MIWALLDCLYFVRLQASTNCFPPGCICVLWLLLSASSVLCTLTVFFLDHYIMFFFLFLYWSVLVSCRLFPRLLLFLFFGHLWFSFPLSFLFWRVSLSLFHSSTFFCFVWLFYGASMYMCGTWRMSCSGLDLLLFSSSCLFQLRFPLSLLSFDGNFTALFWTSFWKSYPGDSFVAQLWVHPPFSFSFLFVFEFTSIILSSFSLSTFQFSCIYLNSSMCRYFEVLAMSSLSEIGLMYMWNFPIFFIRSFLSLSCGLVGSLIQMLWIFVFVLDLLHFFSVCSSVCLE